MSIEKELGRIKWGKNRELVVRYAEFTNKKKPKRGIDIRFYVSNLPEGYVGWSKWGVWINESEIKNFAAMIQKGLEIYEAQQKTDQSS